MRIPEIDGLRGLAIISVIFWHYFAGVIPTEPGTLPAYLLLPFSLTHSGVHLFFVLSGLLIGGILLDAKDSQAYFRTFYVRRAFRILPLYWMLTTAYVVGGALFSLSYMFDGAAPAPIYYLLLQDVWMKVSGNSVPNGFIHTWSLAVEEQFYLVLPLAIRFLSRRQLIGVLIAIILATPFLRHMLSEGAGYFRFTNMDFFAFGVLTALAYRERVTINPKILFGGFALIYGLMALHRMPFKILHPTFLGLAYAMLVMAVLNTRLSLVSWKPLQTAGILCFGLYLFHVPVQGLVFALLLGRTDGNPGLTDTASVLATLFSLTITILLSLASWRVIERPLIDYSHRWSYKDRALPPETGNQQSAKFRSTTSS